MPGSKVQALEDFFRRALEVAPKACRGEEHNLQLGPLNLRLHLGSGLAKNSWHRPLAARPSEKEPEATIYAWDESAGKTGFPPPPWGEEFVYTHRGDIQGFGHEQIKVSFSLHSGLLSMYHREERVGIYWTTNAARMPGYEWAAPMRRILNWIGIEHGLQLTHAGAVGVNGRGLLLTGKGGSGKSTTTLACLHAGWDFVSDDYCWVSTEPVPTAHAVYRTAKLRPEQHTDLPNWNRDERLSEDKDVFDLRSLDGANLVDSLKLEALLLPRPQEVPKAKLRKAEKKEAVANISLTTMSQLACSGPKNMNILRDLAQTLPSYHLDLCHPVSSVPQVMGELFR